MSKLLKLTWKPNKITKINDKLLRKKYLTQGKFIHYTVDEIPNHADRAWVNTKIMERANDRIRKVRMRYTPEIAKAYREQGILAVSSALGLTCILLGIRRTHLMGALMIPVIFFYIRLF